MAAPGPLIPVDLLIRRMYGYDVSKTDLDDLHKLDAGQLGVLRDLILERLSQPGPVDKDALKSEIRAEMDRLLASGA